MSGKVDSLGVIARLLPSGRASLAIPSGAFVVTGVDVDVDRPRDTVDGALGGTVGGEVAVGGNANGDGLLRLSSAFVVAGVDVNVDRRRDAFSRTIGGSAAVGGLTRALVAVKVDINVYGPRARSRNGLVLHVFRTAPAKDKPIRIVRQM